MSPSGQIFAGASIYSHLVAVKICSEESEVHGVGYETLGKKTVLYNRSAPCFEGDVALSELENLDDLALSIFICSVSVKSHDFHTPR